AQIDNSQEMSISRTQITTKENITYRNDIINGLSTITLSSDRHPAQLMHLMVLACMDSQTRSYFSDFGKVKNAKFGLCKTATDPMHSAYTLLSVQDKP